MLRHFWTMLAVFTIVCAAGVFYTMRQPEMYRAKALIQIQTATPPVMGRDIDATLLMLGSYHDASKYRATQNRILKSSTIAEEVARRLDLYNDLEFLGLTGVQDPEELAQRLSAADPVPRITRMLTVIPDQTTMLIALEAVGTNPKTCADIVNTTAEVYRDHTYGERIASVSSAIDWLQEQYQQLRSELESSEASLYNFRRERNLLGVSMGDQHNLTARAVSTLFLQLSEARLSATQLQTTVDQLQGADDVDELLELGIEEVVNNDLIQELKGQLTLIEAERIRSGVDLLGEHPQMVALDQQEALIEASLNREITNAISALRVNYDSARALESMLQSRLDSVYSEALVLGETELEYEQLEREVIANRAIFDSIEQRLKEVELAEQMEQNNVEIIERARVPGAPFKPNKLMNVAGAAIVGLFLAIGVAVLLEMLDNTVKTQQQIESKFGVPFLGVIPTIRATNQTRQSTRGPMRGEEYNPDTFVDDYPKSTVAESCRSIRTNLMFMSTDKPLERILVTSAGPLDGKTTTAVSIATVLAHSGNRILVVDTDMRRPRLHRAFRMDNSRGLTDLLLGEASYEECIRSTKINNLQMMSCGPIPPNPTELMYTERYRTVIEELGKRFDTIVFDSPPVAPVTDAAILAGLVDGVIVVTRAGKTRKDLFGKAIQQLDAVEANILGVVLNDVDLQNRRYGYYYYYYRHYGQYYGSDDDGEEAGQASIS